MVLLFEPQTEPAAGVFDTVSAQNTFMSTTKLNAVAVTKPSAINLMASRLSVEPAKLFETLKSTVFQKATNEELLALVVVANEYGLNPFLKELYAFPAKGGGIVPIVSVDGWNKMLVRQPDFDGIEFDFAETEAGELVSCTATIHVKNRSHPVKITEYMAECKRNTEPWNNMPHRMLRNRTLCQASRIAFGFSGVKHEEEIIDVVSTVMPAEPLKAIGAPAGDAKAEAAAGLAPAEKKSPQAELESLCVTNGHTFDAVQKWGVESGNIEGADSMAGFADVPNDVCKRLLRAQAGLLKGLEQVKKS
jgi:phage recombination protein Bet